MKKLKLGVTRLASNEIIQLFLVATYSLGQVKMTQKVICFIN